LTFTAERKFPGVQGPRHWLRSSPDGSAIAFLMKDDAGVAQLWTVSPNGGSPRQLTRNATPIASAFTWSPDGRLLAHVMDHSVCVTDSRTGATRRLTAHCDDTFAPRPEACVFSPDGQAIAYARPVKSEGHWFNQVHVVTLH
ncbi:MAG TPA: biopolymer transporter Tol, partial [Verrucomicrobiae bacterium]